MGKQPYIPFYVGDYLKDTRILPLSVRGAWVDLILYMWESPVRGELIGTIEDFARLMSCEKSEATFALDLLKQKSIADFELLNNNQIKITSRKMKRESEISKKRSDAGKNGVYAKKDKQFAEAKQQANIKQNTEYEYEVKNEDVIVIEDKGVKGDFSNEWFKSVFDELMIESFKSTFREHDVDNELKIFMLKVRGSPGKYEHRDTESIRQAFLYQLQHSTSKKNGNRNGTQKTNQSTTTIIEPGKSFGLEKGFSRSGSD